MNLEIPRRIINLAVAVSIMGFSACVSSGGGGGDSTSSTGGFDVGTSADPNTSTADSSGPSIPNTFFANSIQYCGTQEPDTGTLQNLSTLFAQFNANRRPETSTKEGGNTVTVAVHFHVISKGAGYENGEVPDDLMIEQINVLNRAFSGETGGTPTPYRFTLAGINRVTNPEWHVMSPGSETELKAKEALKVGGPETLNVYLVDIEAEGGAEGTILGYATLPVFYGILAPYDGVVVNFRTIAGGTIQRYNTGHVLVHEAGHWLGLLHTFQGECDGIIDDLVLDTPRERIPERGEFCPTQRDSCPNLDGVDPVHNHMTYTEDTCRTDFTQGQIDFMLFNTTVFRNLFID